MAQSVKAERTYTFRAPLTFDEGGERLELPADFIKASHGDNGYITVMASPKADSTTVQRYMQYLQEHGMTPKKGQETAFGTLISIPYSEGKTFLDTTVTSHTAGSALRSDIAALAHGEDTVRQVLSGIEAAAKSPVKWVR